MHYLFTNLGSRLARLAAGNNATKYYQASHLSFQKKWTVLRRKKKEIALGCGCDRRPVSSSYKSQYIAARPNAQDPEEVNEVSVEMFPEPVNGIKTLDRLLQDKCDKAPIFSISSNVEDDMHTVEVTLNWPEIQIFGACSTDQKTALQDSCRKALHWLFSNKHMTKTFRPIMSSETTRMNTINLNLMQADANKLDKVLQLYSEEIVPALSDFDRTWKFYEYGSTHIHPTLGIPYPPSEDLEEWNKKLKPLRNPQAIKLPIDEFREEIIKSVRNNRVTIVKGATGCGKTTKVPQFILDDAIARGRGAYCNIAVCLPRKLTAKETARYVAACRWEPVGRSVGYSVRMEKQFATVLGGSITFMTGQKLALKFACNNTLRGVSHVILDEVHLRDIGTDLTMHLLRQALETNEDLRVIIMSATILVDTFESYFSGFSPLPVIDVPGRTFPVKEHFLEDLPSILMPDRSCHLIDGQVQIDYSLVQRVVLWIHKTKPPGGILVFVSGWSDIVALTDLIQEPDLRVMPLHRKLKDNSPAIKPIRSGLRKVILATNVAETSITIPDTVYVVDCGVHKISQRKFISRGRWAAEEIKSTWIAKTNVIQRRGRAGRVSPGEAYHLFTRETFNRMEEQQLPGILSCALENVIMTTKLVNPKMDAAELIKDFPDPPTPKDINETVASLKELSFLSHSDETPTALAVAALKMSAPLPSAKALIQSAIFRCVDTMVSVLSSDEETPIQIMKASDERSLKLPQHSTSDHIAKSKLINSCFRTRNLQRFYKYMISGQNDFFPNTDMNEHDSEVLVKSILLHSFGSLLVRVETPINRYMIDHSGSFAKVTPRSVNFNVENMPFPFATYLKRQGNDRVIFIDDTSCVSPLSVLLFLPTPFKTEEIGLDKIQVRGWSNKHVSIVLSKEDYARIEVVRRSLKDLIEYFVITEILNYPDENYNLLCKFRRDLLNCINSMLSSPQCSSETDL